MSKPSTPTLPLYNIPRSQAPQLPGRYNARYMMIAVFCFLSLAVFYTFGRAAPIIVRPQELDVTDAVNEAIKFHNNIEAMTDIYRGTEDTASLDNLNHLIIVTGHAILLDKANYQNDEAWILEPFQKGGQIHTFVDHILKGIELAKADDKSLLMFSGFVCSHYKTDQVEVKHVRWPDLEASRNRIGTLQTISIGMILQWRSYCYGVWHRKNLLGTRMRICCSLYAAFLKLRDDIQMQSQSLVSGLRNADSENSIAELSDFRTIGLPLKRRRLTFRFAYVGIDPPGADIQELKRLEDANAASHFQADPYACSSPVLAGKRLQRNPFRRMHGYGKTNTALLDLLSWCPEQGSRDIWFNKSLPWERNEL